MSAPATTERGRLPGVSFETVRLDTGGRLPRMDVTAFVGLAAAGPFDVPVRIEDPLHFREVFGDDLELTADAPAVRSLLGPTVDAYFANGGRVCWVTRVGAREEAQRSVFPVPGLVEWHPVGPRPARVEARSPGSAFDGIQVAGTASRRSLVVEPASAVVDADRGSMEVSAATGVRPGQLLELTWADGTVLWVPVATAAAGAFGRLVVGWADATHWFRRSAAGDRPAGASHLLSGSAGNTPLAETRHSVDDDGASTLTTTTLLVPSVVGDIVVRPTADGTAEVFVVDDVRIEAADRTVLRSLTTWQQLAPAAVPPVTPITRASVVTVGLVAFDRDTFAAALTGLDPVEAGARWWGHLPSDETCFGGAYRRATSDGDHPRPGPLDADVLRPRLPLAAHRPAPTVLPLGLRDDPLTATRSALLDHTEPSTTRDGVRSLSSSWFVDDALPIHDVRTLDRTARRRFFVDGLDLRGIHATIPVEEVAVLSVPDAAHTGWVATTVVPPAPLTAPVLAPWTDPAGAAGLAWTTTDVPSVDDRYELEAAVLADFSGPIERDVFESTSTLPDLEGCDPRWFRVRVRRGARRSGWSNSVLLAPRGGEFAPCEVTAVGIPVLERPDPPTLRWHLVPPIDEVIPTPIAFELEAGADPAFTESDRIVVTVPPALSDQLDHTIDPSPDRHTWYRVRVRPEVGVEIGPWSRTIVVAVAPRPARVAVDSGGIVATTAVEVHRAMAALTASRLDLTALISFPDDYWLPQIAEHLARVRAGGEVGADGRNWVDLLHAHHPWVASVDRSEPVWSPPDGAVAGRMATGALERGAWVSTAGSALERAVDVRRRLDIDDVLALRDHHVNAIVPDRADFVVIGNDTLAADRTIAPVTVRRVLIVLRRLVRREGDVVVFENNGPILWNILRNRFEQLLGGMFRRGAFAGKTPAEAYRVICDRGLNPPANLDAGMLVVELQVAPSQPLEFLRIRFVQTDATGPDLLEVLR